MKLAPRAHIYIISATSNVIRITTRPNMVVPYLRSLRGMRAILTKSPIDRPVPAVSSAWFIYLHSWTGRRDKYGRL